MEKEEVQKLVEEVSLEYFGKPFKHNAVFNERLRTTGGRYLLGTHHIELNLHYYLCFGKEELVDVIKHELCHYHLHLEGKGYKHRDRDFRELMKKVGAPRFCKTIKEKERIPSLHIYQCVACKYVYKRKRRVDTEKYVCGKCRGKLEKVEKGC
ncbi:SprT family protein [Priestia taiwanensis]|uniref:Protein SprT-like n=1 Tax=Priestia taiwanensis TaxID=1347902 RepID=A0A917ES04_9BACI|nr:SprT family protein [Priestia taiwanensis]MBM7365224.1 SprT-like protein [Priestia taiwanensis]GGE85609.1 protein SprT [Priestia taiwanensis]